MAVIDVIHPYVTKDNFLDDHIEVICVPTQRVRSPEVTAPALHSLMAAPLALMADGRMSEAVTEALRLVEERVQALTASDDSGPALMESVFGTTPPQLDITTTTGRAAEDEREGFRLLFVGAMLGLRGPHDTGTPVSAAADEALEYLAVASMLMRRLDRVQSRLNLASRQTRRVQRQARRAQ